MTKAKKTTKKTAKKTTAKKRTPRKRKGATTVEELEQTPEELGELERSAAEYEAWVEGYRWTECRTGGHWMRETARAATKGYSASYWTSTVECRRCPRQYDRIISKVDGSVLATFRHSYGDGYAKPRGAAKAVPGRVGRGVFILTEGEHGDVAAEVEARASEMVSDLLAGDR